MVLHVALLVAPTHPAEVVVEEVVAFEGQEPPGQLALVADDLGHRDGGVVIGDPQRHAAEELEARHVGGLEGLGALARIGAEEVRVRIGQRDDAQMGLGANAVDLDHRLAEVELGVAGRVTERDERLLGVLLGPLHGRLDLRVAAGVAVFVAQALEDSSGRVTLLGRSLFVVGQDLLRWWPDGAR